MDRYLGYVTLEETKEFLSLRYDISMLVDDDLAKALYRAFDKIENLCIRNRGEVKAFPRLYETEVPQNIKNAQMIEAFYIATSDDNSQDNLKGISSKSIGDMSISYNSDSNQLLSDFVSIESSNILSRYIRRTF